MNQQNIVVHNEDIKFQRIFAIMIAFTFVLIPISLLWLYWLRTPTDIISGNITSKKSGARTVATGKGSTIKHTFYVSISEKNFEVSGNMYKELKVGDYVSGAYRKDLLYYFSKF